VFIVALFTISNTGGQPGVHQQMDKESEVREIKKKREWRI
jgi:hypothetical protein